MPCLHKKRCMYDRIYFIEDQIFSCKTILVQCSCLLRKEICKTIKPALSISIALDYLKHCFILVRDNTNRYVLDTLIYKKHIGFKSLIYKWNDQCPVVSKKHFPSSFQSCSFEQRTDAFNSKYLGFKYL